MKTAAKVLCILGLVFGLIWTIGGFLGSWFGGAVTAGFRLGFLDDYAGGRSAIYDAANSMIGHIIGFIIVILAGVLGIVGADKNPNKAKATVLGLLTLVFGIFLLISRNYIAGVLYPVAGILLVFAGMSTKNAAETAIKIEKY
jgi:hypothetical protein